MKLLLGGLATVWLMIAQTAPADRNSQIAHEQLLAKARRGRIDIYFEGDSITRRRGGDRLSATA
jgi:hypothetical protein